MALSKTSIKKLRQIGKDILTEYDLYNQCEPPNEFHSCMTPSCLGGWALWNENPNEDAYLKAIRAPGNIICKMATALGITYEQADALYAGWPGGETAAWKKPCTRSGARDGVKHIDLFIKNGGSF